MSTTDKIAQVLALISQHNDAVDEDGSKVDSDRFIKKLKDIGGTTEAARAEVTWEDLEDCGLPRILARKAAAIFRQHSSTGELSKSKFVSSKQAERMNVRELVEAYDPKDRDRSSAIEHVLLARIGEDRPVLVFSDDGSVDVESTVMLINEARDGYRPRKTVVVNDKPLAVYKLGSRPDMTVDENPLYPGMALRPDQTCQNTNRSWKNISRTVRQLLYIANSLTHEWRDKTNLRPTVFVRDIHDLFDMMELAGDNLEAKLRLRYPKASIMLDELASQGNTPSLKIALREANAEVREQQDPFFSGHRRH
jgi:hypothetical protein